MKENERLWTGTATLIFSISVLLIGVLFGMNDFLEKYRVEASVIETNGGKIQIVGKPVLEKEAIESTEERRELYSGVRAMNLGNFDQAVKIFNDYLYRQKGTNPLAHYFLGFSLRGEKREKDAIPEFESYLVNTNPGDSIFRISAAFELMYALAKGNNQTDLSKAFKILKQYELEAKTCNDLGERGQYAKAGYQVINQLGELKRSENPLACLEILAQLSIPIAGIKGSNESRFWRNFFRTGNLYVDNEMSAKRKNNAIRGWNILFSNEKYLTRVKDTEERKAYYDLKREVLVSLIPQVTATPYSK